MGSKKSNKQTLEDPLVAYHRPSPFLGILYGNTAFESDDTAFMKVTRQGVEKSSIKVLSEYLGLTQEKISECLHSSLRNLQRKDDDELLDISKSERVMELTAFAKQGTRVLGGQEALAIWLQSPLMALQFKTPMDFLDTTFGLNILYKILGRIEHGVYS